MIGEVGKIGDRVQYIDFRYKELKRGEIYTIKDKCRAGIFTENHFYSLEGEDHWYNYDSFRIVDFGSIHNLR